MKKDGRRMTWDEKYGKEEADRRRIAQGNIKRQQMLDPNYRAALTAGTRAFWADPERSAATREIKRKQAYKLHEEFPARNGGRSPRHGLAERRPEQINVKGPRKLIVVTEEGARPAMSLAELQKMIGDKK